MELVPERVAASPPFVCSKCGASFREVEGVTYGLRGRFRKKLEAMVNREIAREARRLEHHSKTGRKASKGRLRSVGV
jgi:hypothetical protein